MCLNRWVQVILTTVIIGRAVSALHPTTVRPLTKHYIIMACYTTMVAATHIIPGMIVAIEGCNFAATWMITDAIVGPRVA